jgi:hypothetical protein
LSDRSNVPPGAATRQLISDVVGPATTRVTSAGDT